MDIQTTVSAPSSGVRKRDPIVRRKRGSEVRTAGVSAQPGCIAFTVTPLPARRSAHISVSTTRARFASA